MIARNRTEPADLHDADLRSRAVAAALAIERGDTADWPDADAAVREAAYRAEMAARPTIATPPGRLNYSPDLSAPRTPCISQPI